MRSGHIKVKNGTHHLFYMAIPRHTTESVTNSITIIRLVFFLCFLKTNIILFFYPPTSAVEVIKSVWSLCYSIHELSERTCTLSGKMKGSGTLLVMLYKDNACMKKHRLWENMAGFVLPGLYSIFDIQNLQKAFLYVQ